VTPLLAICSTSPNAIRSEHVLGSACGVEQAAIPFLDGLQRGLQAAQDRPLVKHCLAGVIRARLAGLPGARDGITAALGLVDLSGDGQH